MAYEAEVNTSLTYLNSNGALASIARDAYWPKWNSPWWHMLLLHEMGLAKSIPQRVIEAYVRAMNNYPVKIFPIQENDMPAGVDPQRGTCCHCQIGNVYQVLATAGVNVDRDLPWMRPWLLRYQMADGGMNCDNAAYLVKDEVPSSMVGMISAFEAVLLHTPRAFTAEEKIFLGKGAQFLVDRELRLGSTTKYNASERKSAETWGNLCFPRFYPYDILRGLNAILLWSEKTGGKIPAESIRVVFEDLSSRFPDGRVTCGRLSFANTTTVLPLANGEVLREQPASIFPLLTAVNTVGEVSPYLSKQWQDCKAQARALIL